MTRKRTKPTKVEAEESKVTTAQATQVLTEERQQRVAIVQAAIQAVLRDQNCALDMEIVLNGEGVRRSNIVIMPLADQGDDN